MLKIVNRFDFFRKTFCVCVCIQSQFNFINIFTKHKSWPYNFVSFVRRLKVSAYGCFCLNSSSKKWDVISFHRDSFAIIKPFNLQINALKTAEPSKKIIHNRSMHIWIVAAMNRQWKSNWRQCCTIDIDEKRSFVACNICQKQICSLLGFSIRTSFDCDLKFLPPPSVIAAIFLSTEWV